MMETIFKEIINSAIKPIMKEAGFKKKALTFQKTLEDLIFIVNLQKSHGNTHSELGFYINCGIYNARIAKTLGNDFLEFPKEYQCHYRSRIEEISTSSESKFIITPNSDHGKLSSQLKSSLTEVVTLFGTLENHEKFMSFLSKSPIFDSFSIFKYCIREDLFDEAVNILSLTKTNLKDSSRWEEKIRPRFLEIISEEKSDFIFTELDFEQKTELPSDTLETFNHYFEKGLDWGIADGDYPFAIDYFKNYCLSLLPEPKTSYKESTKVYTKLGEAYLLNKEYQKAIDSLEIARTCPNPEDEVINSLLETCTKK